MPSPLLAIVTFALAGWLLAQSQPVATDYSPETQLQLALDDLRKADYEGAELRAKAIHYRSGETARGWLVIAASRQHRKMHDEAITAYRSYLVNCPSAELRQWVLEQIEQCRAALTPPQPLKPATADLAAADLAELAKVDEQTYTESSEHFVVKSRNAKLAKLVVAQGEASLNRISRGLLGMTEFPHSVEVNVWADHKDYLANAQDAPEWAGGSFSISVANGVVTRRIDLTQLEADGKFSTRMLDRILPHELCHVVTKEYFGDTNCPLFLDEGLAMLAETQVDNARVALAGAALAGEGKLPLEGLLASRRGDIEKIEVFYAEAYSFTDFLRGRLGQRQFKDFLDHVRGGCTVADAVQRALYVPAADDSFLTALAAAWQDQAVQQSQITRALLDAK